MSFGYSKDLRIRSLIYYDTSGKTQAEVSAIFKISLRTFNRWVRLQRETGDCSPKERPKQRKLRKLNDEALIAFLKENPDSFLHETGKHFKTSAAAIYYACKRIGWSRKKNKPVHRTK